MDIVNPKLAWKLLNGVFVLYKPSMVSMNTLRKTITMKLCRDLDSMSEQPIQKHVFIEGDTNKEMSVVVKDSWADHPLVMGPRHLPQDIKLHFSKGLGFEGSGVLVCSINKGSKILNKIIESRPTRTYIVKGILGQAKDNCFSTGRIVEKSTWRRIKRIHLDTVCASLQSEHQKSIFDAMGVDMNSQEAYDLAVKGLVRPTVSEVPIIYSIKCIDFKPPEFTLEMVCINEKDDYLKLFIHELGIKLHSTAHCNYIQCTKYGLFTIDHALLIKHWDLQNILDSIQECDKIISMNKYIIENESHLVEEKSSA